MNRLPEVSIIIPVYQGSQYLHRIVESCLRLRQISSSFASEIVFICDDPVDDSSDIAFQLASSVPWIKAINLASNSGQHVATAAGMLHASGEWILTIDEDLQFDPGLSPYMLREALGKGLDLVYAKNKECRRGTHSRLRNFYSSASKLLVGSIAKDDYTSISSFRLIRSEIAQSVASTIDKHSFLDTSLFAVTSNRRRGVYSARLIDTRQKHSSGYSFARLIRHYGRFISSANISSLSILAYALSSSSVIIFCGVIIQLLTGIAGGSQSVAPGWASQVIITTALFGIAFGYLTGCIKLLSILVQRSSGIPRFIPVDRSKDEDYFKELSKLLA